ncbi:hypothetical protein [Nostoc sp. MG11]|nr:hypothetical protein [Nostoc sp. MG11]
MRFKLKAEKRCVRITALFCSSKIKAIATVQSMRSPFPFHQGTLL